MPTDKTRINVSLPAHVEKILDRLAKRDDIPRATKALELIRSAMETDEDEIWDALASQRDVKKAKFVSHSSAWK